MTKQDYVMLARILSNAGQAAKRDTAASALDGVKTVAAILCDELKIENPRFQEQKFLDAINFGKP